MVGIEISNYFCISQLAVVVLEDFREKTGGMRFLQMVRYLDGAVNARVVPDKSADETDDDYWAGGSCITRGGRSSARMCKGCRDKQGAGDGDE